MNPRASFRYLLLIICFICSSFFMLITNKLSNLDLLATIYAPIISINILMLNKKKTITKNKRTFIIILTILSILSLSFITYYLYLIISEFIKFNTINLRWSNTYFILLFIIIVNDLEDIKTPRSNIFYDILTILVTIIIILIHYRYYLDGNFLHNLLKINDINSIILQNSYIYITQYYPLFSIMYICLILYKKVNNHFENTYKSNY